MVPQDKDTPLHAAARGGDPDTIRALLETRASLDAVNSNRNTPLHLAAAAGKAEAVRALLSAGASLEAGNEEGSTPLVLAAWNGHVEVITILLAGGAQVNARKKDDGCSPLHEAAYNGHVGATQALVRARAKLNSQASGQQAWQLLQSRAPRSGPAASTHRTYECIWQCKDGGADVKLKVGRVCLLAQSSFCTAPLATEQCGPGLDVQGNRPSVCGAPLVTRLAGHPAVASHNMLPTPFL